MRPIGFSTGALAKGDFMTALGMLRRVNADIRVVELSALRQEELPTLVDALPHLPLAGYTYVSVHAPSRLEPGAEAETLALLSRVVSRGFPIVVHPDVIIDFAAWSRLGASLIIENMDKRKPIGRTASELRSYFERLPLARMCFDLGHARQVDPTMTKAVEMLSEFGNKLVQVHLSDVNTRSTHDPLSRAAILAFEKVAALIPEETPIVLETPVPENQIVDEMVSAEDALPTLAQFVAD